MYNNDQNMMKVQKSCLDVLKIVADICDKNGLTYFIVSGTLIGSIRHKGFIPWDDDIDIAMPRDDYEKLIIIAEHALPEGYFLNHYSKFTYPDLPTTHHVQVTNNRILLLKEWSNHKREIHPWIDIFPLDGMPNRKISRYIHYYHYMFWHYVMQLSWFNENINVEKANRNIVEKIIIFIVSKLTFLSRINTIEVMKKMDKIATKYPFKNGDYIVSFHGTYKLGEILPEYFFNNSDLYEFEGEMFHGPKNYDPLLRHYYGDYLELPPAEERVQKHKYSIIRIEED